MEFIRSDSREAMKQANLRAKNWSVEKANKPPEAGEVRRRSKGEQVEDFRKIQNNPHYSDRAKKIAQKGIDNIIRS